MKLPSDPLPVVMVGGAALILECSTTHVRYLARIGRLAAVRLENNHRVFVRLHVEQLAAERAAARAARKARG